jgi:hypothetical protein
MKTLRQFPVNFFGLPAPDVSGSLQAALDFVGKGHQHKRHGKPGHSQPESTASGTTSRFQARVFHRRSLGLLIRPRSNETSSVIGYIYNIGLDLISTGVRACQLTREQSSGVVDEARAISAFAKSSGIWFRGRAEVSFRLA